MTRNTNPRSTPANVLTKTEGSLTVRFGSLYPLRNRKGSEDTGEGAVFKAARHRIRNHEGHTLALQVS